MRRVILLFVLFAGQLPGFGQQASADVVIPAGAVTIRPVHTEKCCDIEGASTRNGTPVKQTECNGHDYQRFLIESSAGYWRLRPAHDLMCLDISGRSTGDGANLQQWNCANQPNQRFWFERV